MARTRVVRRSPSPYGNPNTTSLSYRADGRGLPRIYQKLLSCPNISELSLKMANISGCRVYNAPWAFDFQDGDRFPAIKKLTIDNYRFEHKMERREPQPWTTYLPESIQNFVRMELGIFKTTQDHEPNLHKWQRAMDWTQLEYLDISHDHFFLSQMVGRLPGLRSLTVTGGTDCDLFKEFLNGLPSLESLKIMFDHADFNSKEVYNRSSMPLETILRHGKTLKSLTLGRYESYTHGSRRATCSLEEIERIYSACPHLSHFGLDIDRDGSWPCETLHALGAHEEITSLYIRLELGANLHGYYGYDEHTNEGDLSNQGPYREPQVSRGVAKTLFGEIRAKKKGKGLRKLLIEVGDWEEDIHSGPIYARHWAEHRARRFFCEANEAEQSVSCTEGPNVVYESGDEDENENEKYDEDEGQQQLTLNEIV